MVVFRNRPPAEQPATTSAQPPATVPAQQPPEPPGQQSASFSPPIAMQQSIWDLVVMGNFVDAKIFAYSQRRDGRVHTPKALFVNTHVLASACDYFRSTFDLDDGVETSLTAGLPPGFDAALDFVEEEFDHDYDFNYGYDFGEEPLGETQMPSETPTQTLPERPVKAYLVKYTSYRTLRAIIWYIYSGGIAFFSDGSRGSLVASAKSIYRFAEEHGMNELRSLAFGEITRPVLQLQQSAVMRGAFDPFVSRYPQIRSFYIQRLRYFLAYGPNEVFRDCVFRYFAGELPHSRELLTSLLQAVMDGPAVRPLFDADDDLNTIPRVCHPWPDATGKALLASLDCGTFEDIYATVSSGPESTGEPIYFAAAVNGRDGSPMLRTYQSESTSQQDSEVSPLALRAVAYYLYTNCITFEPPGSLSADQPHDQNPSDPQFRGYRCSPKEVLFVARKLGGCDQLVNLAADEIASRLAPENVVEEMFHNPPAPTQIVDRGVEIIREHRENAQIRSQLQRIAGEAASGDNSENAAAFFACLVELLRGVNIP